jgi:hypothetical protein
MAAAILERGNIYFVYRPRVEHTSAHGLEDVQRFFLVLSPHGRSRHRLIVIGRKKLPETETHRDRGWAFVGKVSRRPEDIEDDLDALTYSTLTRGERHLAPARPAGEGIYALVRHGDHTHLTFALELPEEPGAVQRELNIPEEGSYIVAVKNPQQPAPPGVGLAERKQPRLPARLRDRFYDRRFAPVDPPAFLDHEGIELVFIGAGDDVSEELGIRLDPQRETLETAEIFNDLRVERNQHPLQPLFEGKWR